MLTRVAALLALLAASLFAQSTCPSVNFLTARTVNLKPSPTTHIDAVRQSDGSYTGFEVTDAAPYRLIESTPHFEQQFAACIPHTLPAVPSAAPPLTNPAGAASQIQVAAAIGSNYFVAHISTDGITLDFDLFDAQHNLVSEKPFTSIVTPPGYVGSANESFESLALADLNGDGKLDLVAVLDTPLAADIAYGGVWTFVGNGDGTFQPGNRQVLTSRSLLAAAVSATIGDLNGDGKPDLILVAPSSGPLNVFLGNGDGSFQTKPLPVTIPADWGNPVSVALADLNGDGHPDLVLSPCFTQGSSVAIALGNGDGTFQTAALHAALFPGKSSAAAAMAAIGDLNGDGIPDIVTSGGTILFGDGKGGVASRADYGPNFTAVPFSQFLDTGGGLVSQGASVMLGDFDGDGKTDILFGSGNPTYLSGSASYPTLTVLFGAGAGVFTAAPVSAVPLPGAAFTYSGPIAPPLGEALLPGDFNRDGIADLMHVTFAQTADDAGNVELTLLQGRGNGQFSPSATQTFAHAGNFLLESAIAADFNHDGKLDIAVLLHDYPATSEVQIYLGKGDGTFAAPLSLSGPNNNVFSLAAPDLNGDGIPDLAVITDISVTVYLGKGDGTFGLPSLTTTSADPAVAFGDFTGDGKLDMAVVSPYSALSIFPGKDDGTFSAAISTMLPSPASGYSGNIVAADFNGDGKLDLAVSLGTQVAILLGKGNGTFTAQSSAGAMLSLAVADINGDKIPDLIGFVNSTAPLPEVAGNLSVRLGNGDGTFQSDNVVLGLSSFFTVADFNRDGSPDVAALYGGGVLTLLNYSQPNAPLTVVSAATYSAGPLAPGAIAAAFGEGILPSGQSQSGAAPLPTSLLGISITVLDSAGVSRQAPLYFVSPTQINFLVPAATAAGLATVTVNGAPMGKPLSAQVQITAAAPALFSVGSDIAAAYAIQVAPGGTQAIVPVFTVQSGAVVATPIDLTQPGLVYLTLFGTGLDAAPATSVSATVQGVSVPVTYFGPQGTYAGLDQINLLLPQTLAGAGVASVSISVAGQHSNTVFVTIR